MSDSDVVTSYAKMGIRLWANHVRPHGILCPCLVCADARAYFDLWLVPNIHHVMVAPKNEDKERSV